jgi:hypothetical protein
VRERPDRQSRTSAARFSGVSAHSDYSTASIIGCRCLKLTDHGGGECSRVLLLKPTKGKTGVFCPCGAEPRIVCGRRQLFSDFLAFQPGLGRKIIRQHKKALYYIGPPNAAPHRPAYIALSETTKTAASMESLCAPLSRYCCSAHAVGSCPPSPTFAAAAIDSWRIPVPLRRPPRGGFEEVLECARDVCRACVAQANSVPHSGSALRRFDRQRPWEVLTKATGIMDANR